MHIGGIGDSNRFIIGSLPGTSTMRDEMFS